MTQTTYIGIDPGNTGSIVFLNRDGTPIHVQDMPLRVVSKTATVKQNVSPAALTAVMRAWLRPGVPVVCGLEQVSSSPQQGVATAFAFGRNLGTIEGVLGAFPSPIDAHMVTPQAWKWHQVHIDVHMVTPQAWKWHHGLQGTKKDAAIDKARELFPEFCAKSITLKKHIGRADALLIASYIFNITTEAAV